MKPGKERRPHPSQLPKLSPEKVLALENELRAQADSWGWVISPPEKITSPPPEGSTWMKEKPPGIRKFASNMKKAARKIGKSLQRREKK